MQYDCDTRPYWTTDEQRANVKRRWGAFVERGTAYRIDDPDTPRPWLNYLCNAEFGSVISNRGLGFHWIYSTLLRITKYEHPIDYLPRDFEDGREIWIEEEGHAPFNLFRQATDLVCVHRPGITVLTARVRDWSFEATVFVPPDMPVELLGLKVRNEADQPRSLRLAFEQTWSMATFGIHTAEEGIPYLSTPGKAFSIREDGHALWATCADPALPFVVQGLFASPDAQGVSVRKVEDVRKDNRRFHFHVARIEHTLALAPGAEQTCWTVSGAARDPKALASAWKRLQQPGAGLRALRRTRADRRTRERRVQCTLPDKPIQHFLNTWFKHQLHLTFHFTRSGHSGYRDSVQDVWGYTLLDPVAAKKRLLTVLAHLRSDGTAPRQFSNYGDGRHDHRKFMDSGVWIAEALVNFVRETGDVSILKERIPYLDGGEGTVDEHAWRAGQALYAMRGKHGACLTGDGDWNDALEGISRDGDAVSMWLTIALYHSHRQLLSLYEWMGEREKISRLTDQADELRRVINAHGWDGEWFVYGFTGRGHPIGSKENNEGRIHLNAQTWAAFSGVADGDRAERAMGAVDRELQTPLGAALLHPPYVHEASEVGRIARLEPGTFENGSIYLHAVAFQVRAYLALNQRDKAWETFNGVLPTNPENPDARRTSEPYATGNYYCGPGHERFGQNFFTWFTGNSAWLLRIGFDEMLGVKADFDGLRIDPRPPSHWRRYRVTRDFRGCRYDLRFERATDGVSGIEVDGRPIDGTLIPAQNRKSVAVRVRFT